MYNGCKLGLRISAVTLIGVLTGIVEALGKYTLYHILASWFDDSNRKQIVKTESRNFQKKDTQMEANHENKIERKHELC